MIWGIWGNRTDDKRRQRDDSVTTALVRHAGWHLEPARRVTAHLAARWWAGAEDPQIIDICVRDELAEQYGTTPPPERVDQAVSAIRSALDTGTQS